jgi:Tfp pilus assembly protein PilO
MTVGKLDRRTALMLAIGVAVVLILNFGVYGDKQGEVVAPLDSIPMAERRLEKLRQVAATVPGKETVLKQVSEELAVREKGMLKADTPAQAQAQLIDVIRRVGSSNGIDVRGAEELRAPRKLGDDYGEVLVAVAFTCGIEQLVNFLAGVAAEPQIVATNEIHIASGNAKQKTVQVRLSVSGVVPKSLVPEKKGTSF